MRILTVREPWAHAIIHLGKTVENRSRNIAGDYRGPVAIHSAQNLGTKDDFADAAAAVESITGIYPIPPAHRGFIIGVVDLVDVHSASVIGGCGRWDRYCLEHPHGCRSHCSQWAMGPSKDGWYQHLVFENPRALEDPLPWKGALGLRKTDLGVEGDWLVEYHEPCNRPCAGVYGCPPGCGMDPLSKLIEVTR